MVFSNGKSGIDHDHLWSIDTMTGTFTEFYQYVPTGNIAGCSNCNSDSGLTYLPSTYTLPANGSTDAAGLYVMPLVLKLQEMEQAVATGGTINHALRFTLQNGYIKFNSLIWPATATTSAGGGVVPYGARFRLKSSFNISSFSPIAQILLTQLKQYGLILADGGTGWATQPELTYWPQAFFDAFNEIGAANIKPTSFEAVDESGLMVSPLSGATTLSETVVATGIANPSLTARQQVVLTGVTLNLPKDELYIQAGSRPQMLIAYIHGSSNGGITWTMSPRIGTLDSSTGLFTPPASVSTAMVTTVTATSNADPTVAATETITIYPAGPIRLVFGNNRPTPTRMGMCGKTKRVATWAHNVYTTMEGRGQTHRILPFTKKDARLATSVSIFPFQLGATMLLDSSLNPILLSQARRKDSSTLNPKEK